MAICEGKWTAGSLGRAALAAMPGMLASLTSRPDFEQLVVGAPHQRSEARSPDAW
jgi:hypothetical protein